MSVISDEFNKQDQHPDDCTVNMSEISIGQRLKNARTALGLSQAEIAEELKLKESVIRCLDEGDKTETLSPTFRNGYLRAYAQRVGVDSQCPLIDIQSGMVPEPMTTTMQSFSRKVERQNSDKRIDLVTLLFISSSIVSLIVWWYQQSNKAPADLEYVQQVVTDKSKQPETSTAVTAKTPVTDSINIDSKMMTTNNSIDGSDVADNTITSTLKERDSRVVNIFNITDVTESEGEDRLITSLPVEVELTFTGDCWMQLIDSTGEPIAFGTKKAGRVVEVVGYPPFELVLGAPQVVAIQYNGQPFALKNYRTGQTARITLPSL